jgi:hypothetical protein
LKSGFSFFIKAGDNMKKSFLLKYKYWLLLLIAGLAANGILYSIFYNDIKSKSVQELNARQIIHCKQAAKGIESFFVISDTGKVSGFHIDKISDAAYSAERVRIYDVNYESVLINRAVVYTVNTMTDQLIMMEESL